MAIDLIALADELYAAPLADFTPLRDAAAKQAKADAGTDRSAATAAMAAVKGLKKPSVAAWVVNLLVRRESDQVDQVLTVGAALREAAAALDGDELRALTKQRRQVTAAVTTVARRVALAEGVKVTPAIADQIESTLTAAMLDEGAAAAVRSGLLITALAATGVDAVDVGAAVAVPEALGHHAQPRSAPRPDLKSVPALEADPEAEEAARAEARAAAEAELAEAKASLTTADTALAAASTSLEDAKSRSLQIQAELDELRRKVADLESAADDADAELSEAEADYAAAAQARAAAEQRRTAAAEQLIGHSV